ncbi:hypothetical protein V5799_003912 [Amblyomma americanum]|uniref:carbonic anhydrase n=1 Tax=Amblyomma americanum TaxID=6943 RepID=A0AAQ4D7L6_AMBAM
MPPISSEQKCCLTAWLWCWLMLLSACRGHSHWHYGTKGVQEWPQLDLNAENQCGGDFQSPIDIDTRATIYNGFLGPLQYVNYTERLRHANIVNNGHTVMVSPDRGSRAAVTARGLPGVYKFLQFHFHWGASSAEGTEHLVNGRPFAMEMHLVHINTRYGTAEEAYKHPDGLVVVGVFFEAGRRGNRALNSLVKALRHMHEEHTLKVRLSKPLALEDLLPRDAQQAYIYRGSLTTPPCSEAVIWAVLRNPAKISEAQLEAFRELEVEGGDEDHQAHHLVDNFRPPMPLHGRKVFRNFDYRERENDDYAVKTQMPV